jgi:hypothetical protein
MAQMRRIFYWRTKLAILLIDRPVATMLPQAVHRQAMLRHDAISSSQVD